MLVGTDCAGGGLVGTLCGGGRGPISSPSFRGVTRPFTPFDFGTPFGVAFAGLVGGGDEVKSRSMSIGVGAGEG